MPPRFTRKYIRPADRPALLERIRELNAQGWYDTEIGREIGHPAKTVLRLRQEAAIPGVRQRKEARPPEDPNRFHYECPACNLLVDVRDNIIESHNLLGPLRVVRDGEVQLIPRECPASSCKYDALSAAIEQRKQQMGRAA